MTLDKGKIKDSTIDRRKVVIGTAWSIPAIAIAAATPALAASLPPVVVTPGTGTVISNWSGDHHYGSFEEDLDQRAYDFPVTVKDANGNPVVGATVTVTVSGQNDDGDILGIYAHPAPDNDGPESDQSRSVTVVTGADGVALFAVSTQNLSSSERPSTATMTVTVTNNGTTTVSVINVVLTESD
ncbi:transcriptional initiation protein Tat [Arthrobacter sp. ISL-95]|uniref:transcriptional initiation protein Tat n=1 Tax=Arthrobacter sp. ISL-95 TaxID=2819116 RepID=UPI001BEB27B5|nr:transcriptional initiation protein Tat [Arthrobacter sp. ISL-95]MBT2588236.1 transcriptional initiation protein Tat [Arthrobacter sp. ISL-95]